MKSLLRCGILLIGILHMITPVSGQNNPTGMTLQEAIDYAWANSYLMKNAQINVADAEQQINERRSTGLPQLSAEVNYQRYLEIPQQVLPESFVQLIQALNPGEEVSREASFFTRNNFTAGVNLDAMVFDGSYFVGLKAAKAYRQYAGIDLEVQKKQVKDNVIDAYLPVLLANENLALLDKNIGNLQKLLFETQESYKAGFVEQLDVDRLELSLANLEVEKESLVRQKEITLSVLKFALNYPLEEPLTVNDGMSDLLNEASQEDLVSVMDYSLRPEVNLADLGIYLSDLNIKLNKVGYLPVLRAYGAYQQLYQGNTSEDGFWAPTAYVGLRLEVPIFDGLFKKAKIQRAILEKNKAENQRADLVNSIALELTNSRINYLNAKQRLDNQKKNMDLAQRIYDTTQIKYREGVGSSLEVTNAEQALYDTQSNHTRALYDLMVAKFNLDRALGR